MKYSLALLRGTAILAATGLLALPSFAQEVRIIGKDGSIDLTGTLLSTENRQLTLMTPIGQVTVDQAKVICEGAACPQTIEFDYAFSLAGPEDVAEVLIPILFEGYAIDRDAEVTLMDETGFPISEEDFAIAVREGAKVPLQIVDYDGEEIAIFGIYQSEGTGAFDLLASGEVSVLFSQQPALPADIRKVARSGGGNLESFEQEHVVAVDGLTVITHPENPIASISVSNVAAIFSGRITNWSQIGGPDAPIALYAFAPGSDANRDLETLLLQPAGVTQTPSAKVLPSGREIAAAVTADPNGVSVIGFHNKRAARAVPLTNECGMVIPASPFTIKTEEYPLDKRIIAYSRADAAGLAREFIEHMASTNLDWLVSKAGFIDLSVVPEDEGYGAARLEAARAFTPGPGEDAMLAKMIADLEGKSRLSTTFRFAPKSSVLNNRSRRDIDRMVGYIGSKKPSEIYFVGFADSAGPFSDNQRLSESRARQVADQIAAAATDGELEGVAVEVRGFSEFSPVACNETIDGRAINRRVEVWVR